ncbi:hypothetical protein KAI12_00565 [Candidatus Bathyarchaeota archaeon]|nr:hypothetical protein [Candidatus Bathyarchaeota archaeon]
MYSELFSAWKQEIAEIELIKLPSNFYKRLAEYLKRIEEESRMIDKKTMKANLLMHEAQNVKRMVQDLVWIRYKKLISKTAEPVEVPLNLLTPEEEKVCESLIPLVEAYRRFVKNLLCGRIIKLDIDKMGKKTVLRFIEEIPAIIGSDMATYGPYDKEDVASLPIENAIVLVKRGLAEIIEFE